MSPINGTLYLITSLLPFTNAAAFARNYNDEHRTPKRAALPPTVSGTPEVVGIATDPSLNRDSCTSVRVGSSTRSFWTCRDSNNVGDQLTFFASSTASWTDANADGTPKVDSSTLTMYGTNTAPYFPIASAECGPNGVCADGSRYAIWPDSPPLPVSTDGSNYALYTWIPHAHIQGVTSVEENLATTLYRSTVTADTVSGTSADLPPVATVDDAFWAADAIPYGAYGSVISGDTAYLYGKLADSAGVALAKVPIASIEDKTTYSYYTSAGWGSTAPGISDTTAAIPNAGNGGQGTFYYSSYFGSYVWIGGSTFAGADFNIATAPAPEGPWTEPTVFYSAELGTASIPAYSQQAHPGLSADGGNGNDIYLSYTKVDDTQSYSTPLIHVVWQ